MTKARDIANLGDSLINDADDNVALGDGALDSQTTGTNNVAIGEDALASNTSASNNTALGFQAGYDNTTGEHNTFLGRYAGHENTTASDNVAVGSVALYYNTTGTANVAVGRQALNNNTTASSNTAVGYQAGSDNTTGTQQTFIGYRAGSNVTTGNHNTAVGYDSMFTVNAGSHNTHLGRTAGYSSTGSSNTFVGSGAGRDMTTGGSSTIIGSYGGNQSGWDNRTVNNFVVLSDGAGNVLATGNYNSGNQWFEVGNKNFGSGSYSTGFRIRYRGGGAQYGLDFNPEINGANYITFWNDSGSVAGSIVHSGSTSVTYNTSSDYRLKENVVAMENATDRLKQLEPKRFNFIDEPDRTVDGFIAHEVQDIVPEAITGTKDELHDDGTPRYQGIDQSKLVPLLVATIKELEARITALEAN